MISRVSVLAVHVTVVPDIVEPFNLSVTVDPALSAVAVTDVVAVVMFAE